MKITTFQFNPFGENTYVLVDEISHEAAVVDPGMMDDRECKILDDFIKRQDLKIKYLINTHLHIDHVAGDKYIEQKYGVPLSASSDDLFLAERLAQQAQMFHLSVRLPDTLTIGSVLSDGDTITLGSEKGIIIAVPGHSPGSIAIYFPESEFVLTGDALFKLSIGRTDLPGGDYAQLIESITSRLLSLPDKTVVYPGHGPSTTIGTEKQYNPFL